MFIYQIKLTEIGNPQR